MFMNWLGPQGDAAPPEDWNAPPQAGGALVQAVAGAIRWAEAHSVSNRLSDYPQARPRSSPMILSLASPDGR